MELIFFPFERVIEINTQILATEPGMKGAINIRSYKVRWPESTMRSPTKALMMYLKLPLNTLPVSHKVTLSPMPTSVPGWQ